MAIVAQPPSMADTTLPGLTRRRVWSAPAVLSHSLLALTFQRLYLAPAGQPVRSDIVKTIENGGDLESIFGPFGTVVELASINRVRFDLLKNSLTLEYPQYRGLAARPRGDSARAQVVIEFANHEAADEVYTKIWRRLGDRMALRPYRRDFWEMGRTPAALMVGVLLATTLLAVAANSAADEGQSESGVLAGLQSFDWRWVCGLGGGILALLQVWVYRLFIQPPTRLELVAQFSTERR